MILRVLDIARSLLLIAAGIFTGYYESALVRVTRERAMKAYDRAFSEAFWKAVKERHIEFEEPLQFKSTTPEDCLR